MADNKRDVELIIRARADVKKAVDEAVSSIRTLIGATGEAGESAEKAEGLLGSLGTALKGLADEIGTSTGVDKMTETVDALTDANTRQIESLEQARIAWREAQADAEELADTMRSMEEPSDALKAAFDEAKGTSSELRAEYARQANEIQNLAATTTKAAGTAKVAAIAQKQVQQAAAATGPAMQTAAAGTMTLGQAFTSLTGSGRQSMSIMQRLRGQVLSVAASYIGLRAAISGVKQVIDAFRQIEAAEVRLGAVFGTDVDRIGKEMTFLKDTAARLGFSFANLAEDYTKFAIAAKEANFTSEGTRKIFIAVAESARVLRLEADSVSGIFFALEQIISKGTIKTEELRRQLGNRLPGAFNIMADAIGVTTAQLNNMLATGKLVGDEKTMLKFADALTRAFGDQLPDALKTVSAEIGKFQNNLLFAQQRVAAGLIGPFQSALDRINSFFQSREGRDFFLAIGSAAGRAAQALAFLVEHGGKPLLVAIQALIALKIATFFQNIVAGVRTSLVQLGLLKTATATAKVSATSLSVSLGTLGASFASIPAKVVAARTAISAFSITAGATAVKVRTIAVGMGALRGAAGLAATGIRTLVAAFGGLPGLVITGLLVGATILFEKWVTGTDDATQATDELDQALTEIREKVRLFGDEWKNNLEFVNVEKATEIVQGLEHGLADAQGAMANFIASQNEVAATEGWTEILNEVKSLTKQFFDGEIEAEAYRKKLEEISQRPLVPPGADKFITNLSSQIGAVVGAFGRLEKGKLVLEELGQNSDLASEDMKKLTDATDEAADAADRLTAARLKLMGDNFDRPQDFGTGEQEAALLELQKNIDLRNQLREEGQQTDSALAESATQSALQQQAAQELIAAGFDATKLSFGQLRTIMDRIREGGEELASSPFTPSIDPVAVQTLEQVRAKVEEIGGQVEAVGTNFMVFGTAIGDAIEPIMLPMSEAVTAAREFSTEFATVVQGFEQAHGAIAPFGEEFSALAQEFGPFGTKLSGLGQATREFSDALGDTASNIGEAFQDAGATIGNASTEIRGSLESLLQTTDGDFAAVAAGITQQFGAVEVDVTALLQRLQLALAEMRAEIESTRAAANGSGGGGTAVAGFAKGSNGPLRGPGTGTSDSILARVSAGEAIFTAKAVDKLLKLLGSSGFRMLQKGILPIPALAGGMTPIRPLAGGSASALTKPSGTPVNVHLDGQAFPLTGPEDVVESLVGAIRKRNLASAGRAPGAMR